MDWIKIQIFAVCSTPSDLLSRPGGAEESACNRGAQMPGPLSELLINGEWLLDLERHPAVQAWGLHPHSALLLVPSVKWG